MFELEFEVPMERFNQVMDAVVGAEASLRWVYLQEDRGTAVFRVSVPRGKREELLLRIASAADSTEVSIVEETDSGIMVHDAFLATVDTSRGTYPVAIILEYTEDRFHPSKITVATSSSAPSDLLEAVMSLTFGRVNMSSSSVVGRTVSNGTVMLHLEAALPSGRHRAVLAG